MGYVMLTQNHIDEIDGPVDFEKCGLYTINHLKQVLSENAETHTRLGSADKKSKMNLSTKENLHELACFVTSPASISLHLMTH